MLISSDRFNRSCNGAEFMAMIDSIPTGTISSADQKKVQAYEPLKLKYPIKCYCDARSFDELTGYIDLKIIAQRDPNAKEFVLVSGEMTQAHTICSFVVATKDQLSKLEETRKQVSDSKQQDISAELFEL